MNLHRVNTLIESTVNTFQTMLSLRVDAMAPVSKLSIDSDENGITAIVGLSGDLTGSIAVSMPMGCAKRIASVFSGSDASNNADDICDVVGELASMITEGALSQDVHSEITCSCSSVVLGEHQTITGRSSDDRFVIPFSCECGEFSIAVSTCRGDAIAERSQRKSSITVGSDGATQ